MTTTQLGLFAMVWLGGIFYGASVGKAKGSMRFGIISTVFLGPLFGILLIWVVKGRPDFLTARD